MSVVRLASYWKRLPLIITEEVTQISMADKLVQFECEVSFYDASPTDVRSMNSKMDVKIKTLRRSLLQNAHYYYYRFIFRFPIGLDFPFTTFRPQFFLSLMSSYCVLNRVHLQSCPTYTTGPYYRVYNHLLTTATNRYIRIS